MNKSRLHQQLFRTYYSINYFLGVHNRKYDQMYPAWASDLSEDELSFFYSKVADFIGHLTLMVYLRSIPPDLSQFRYTRYGVVIG